MICMVKLVVGLGNPSPQFAGTRHNLGARIVRQWHDTSSDPAVAILLPTTFMNDSGPAVAAYLRQQSWLPADILIVHDDVELLLGHWRFKAGGSATGHRGVRSVHHALGTMDIPRLRVGLGKPADASLKDFVLGKFTAAEEQILAELMPTLLASLTDYCRASVPKTTNT